MTKLLDVIADARRSVKASLDSLTVLSRSKDPYRICDGTDGRWFAEQMERFASMLVRIHLRGLHYRIVAAGDVLRPNGEPYVNDDKCWTWLSDDAAKAARWLGLLPFDRIIDERNTPPFIYVPDDVPTLSWSLAMGDAAYDLWLPGAPKLDAIMPRFQAGPVVIRQPYRIVLVGEKTSLADELRPIAETYGAELILPTGEISDTYVAEMVSRAVADGRKLIVLYISDFDPSGRQMPVSAARKIQALRDLQYPDLDAEVHHVGMTLEQVERFNLPSTPLKETEKRADKWREIMGREQSEVDAMLSLHPGELTRLVRRAIAPFYDRQLERRARELVREQVAERQEQLEQHPEYAERRQRVEAATEAYQQAIKAFEAATKQALQDVRAAEQELGDTQRELADLAEDEEGEIDQPEPEISARAPRPLFTTADSYLTATEKLRAFRAMDGEGV